MYPFALLNDPPQPAYPQYDAVLAEARRITPQFVDPANLAPETDVVRRRGDDWCTAVLGRPYGWTSRITLLEQYLLIAADQLDVDPPLPTWIVEGRLAAAEAQAEKQRRVEAARQRDRDAWAAALAEATVEIDVHHGSHARVRGSLYESLGHAVPRADVYSGTRKGPGPPAWEGPVRDARPDQTAGHQRRAGAGRRAGHLRPVSGLGAEGACDRATSPPPRGGATGRAPGRERWSGSFTAGRVTMVGFSRSLPSFTP